MRLLLILLLAINLGITLTGWFTQPERVAVHFDRSGHPDRWASAEIHAAVLAGLHLLIFGLLLATPSLVIRLPTRSVSLPHRDYWLHPDRRIQTRTLLECHLWRFGAVLLGVHAVLNLAVLRANLRQPPHLDVRPLLATVAAFTVYGVVWSATLWRAFRLPAEDPGSRAP